MAVRTANVNGIAATCAEDLQAREAEQLAGRAADGVQPQDGPRGSGSRSRSHFSTGRLASSKNRFVRVQPLSETLGEKALEIEASRANVLIRSTKRRGVRHHRNRLASPSR